jgi:hypothetical protein
METKNVKLNDAKKHTWNKNKNSKKICVFFYFEAKKVGFFLFETIIVKQNNVEKLFLEAKQNI